MIEREIFYLKYIKDIYQGKVSVDIRNEKCPDLRRLKFFERAR